MAGTPADTRISGVEKAAVLIMSIGVKASAGVFKHLSQDEVKRLSASIASLPKLDRETRVAGTR